MTIGDACARFYLDNTPSIRKMPHFVVDCSLLECIIWMQGAIHAVSIES